MAEPSPSLLWAIVLLVSALSLALGVVALTLTTATVAYIAAPREITTFIDTLDCSIQENETYGGHVDKAPRLEDKVQLSRLLREIQKQGDDLREDLNRLVVEEGGTTLRMSARLLWAARKKQLEERVRRLDMLRMRFLVMFMGIVATTAGERVKESKDAARTAPRDAAAAAAAEKAIIIPPAPPLPPALRPITTKSYSECTTPQKPSRRFTTQSAGPNSEKMERPQRTGWFGVVAELQRSPILRQRHASIEAAMRSPPLISPIGSPLAAIRPLPLKETVEPEKLQL